MQSIKYRGSLFSVKGRRTSELNASNRVIVSQIIDSVCHMHDERHCLWLSAYSIDRWHGGKRFLLGLAHLMKMTWQYGRLIV